MFDFPAAPPIGTVVTTPDGAQRAWDGNKWHGANTGPFLPLAGGTMSGPINLSGPPTAAQQAASKAYVDSLGLGGGGATSRYRVIDVASLLGADPSSGADATPAMQTALGMAAATPGSIIDLCPGDWNFQAAVPTGPGVPMGACFLLPSRTMVRGAGMGQTRMIWNDSACAFNLFDAVPGSSDLALQDFTTVGGWDKYGDANGGGGYPLIFHNVDKLRFFRIGSRYCRANAIVTRFCTDIVTLGCDIRYCAHGAIDHAGCAMVVVANNTIMHSDDNCIAVHSIQYDAWGVRKNIVIVGNIVFDSVGISCVAPRGATITDNRLDCIRLEGIALHEFSNDPSFHSSALGTIVANNVITNMVNESVINGIRHGNSCITISGNSARTGALKAIPGEHDYTTGKIIDDVVYYQSNSPDTSVAVAISRGYIVANNVCARTLPPCDGSATAVSGNGKTYNSWADYGDTDPVGQGRMFLRSGWVNPSLAVSAISGVGVLLNGGSLRDVLITGNQFKGLDYAVNFLNCQPKDVFVRGNHIVDCGTLYGAVMVNLDPTNLKLPCRIYVEDNFIDVDPYQRHPNRLPKGQWNSSVRPQLPAALRVQAGSGVVFRRNTVRNCNTIISNQQSGVFESFDNTMECFPAPSNSGLFNAGIGVVPLDGTRFRHIESDPTNPNYGQLMSVPLERSLDVPTSGYYVVGAWVQKVYSGPDANGAVLLGWARQTTGGSHVLGTDWAAIYGRNAANDLAALTPVGASNGIVASVVFNPPPGEYQFVISDPFPGVVIDPPGPGGTQATAHLPAVAFEIGGTITATTMATDHNLGQVPVFVAPGSLYVNNETLTAVGGVFTQPMQGTIQAGSNGGVASFVVTQAGKYSAFPPDPTGFTAAGPGSGFTMHMQIWSTAGGPIVDGGGFYPHGTPNAVITPVNGDRGGRLTVKMGQSWLANTSGASTDPHDPFATVTIPTVTGNAVTVPLGTDYIVVQDSINPVNTLTVGGGTLADGYELWMSFPNGGVFSGQTLGAHGNLSLKVLGGGWSILSKFG